MALMTRKPFATAFELQRDDVAWTVIVGATRFRIDIDAVDLNAVNSARHVAARSRGQISTKTDAITKHAIITANPPLNEPVR